MTFRRDPMESRKFHVGDRVRMRYFTGFTAVGTIVNAKFRHGEVVYNVATGTVTGLFHEDDLQLYVEEST